MEIFHAYDIRGLYPDEINEEVVFKIAAALVKFLNPDKLVVAHDGRKSSESLKDSVVSAITASGVDVIDIGEATSPLFYFAVNKLGAAGGIMITASHNPPQYNGLKLVREKAIPIGDDSGLLQVKKLAEEIKVDRIKKGRVTRQDLSEDYKEFLLKKAGLPAQAGLLSEPRIKDVRFEFDPDSDRLIVYEKDKQIRADLLSGVIIKDFLDKSRFSRFKFLKKIFGGPKFVYDFRFTKAMPEFIKENGGEALRSRVGYTYIKEKMRKNRAVFGAEFSGHFYFKDAYYSEAPILMKLKLLKIMQETRKSLAELVRPFQKYFHSGEIDFRIRNQESGIKVINKLKEKYKDGKIDELDGLTIEYPDWWFNLRLSHTEPLLRLVIEARAKFILDQKLEEITQNLKTTKVNTESNA